MRLPRPQRHGDNRSLTSATSMATKTKSPIARAKVRLRQGTDRERALYVAMRKATTPRQTIARSRAARPDGVLGIEIPRDRGVAIFPPGRFPEAQEGAQVAQERLVGTDVGSISRRKGAKQFMLPIIDQSELTRESPFMRISLREDVLAAVAAYLGTAPLLTSINIYYSQSSDRGEFISSQLFHCDGDDTTQVKLFVLCNDVTQESGPLMVMPAADSERLRSEIGYRYKDRVTDEEAERVLGDPRLEAVEGPAGTVCLVDTSRCFHYGSRVEKEAPPRLAAMIQYLTPHSFMLPRNATAQAPFKGLVRSDDSERVRLALGA